MNCIQNISTVNVLILSVGIVECPAPKGMSQEKGGAPQRKGMSQERSRAIGTTPVGRTTEEEKEDTNDHTYDFVYVENLAERRGMLYHGLEEEAQDYVRMQH